MICKLSFAITAPAEKFCRARRRAGFTLFELLVVIFIISLTTALVMPSLWNMGDRALKAEAKRLSSTLRYINDEAVGKKETYLLKLDIGRAGWSFEGRGESRTFLLTGNVAFRDIVIPSKGAISGGEVTIEFGPLGPGEPLTIHLMRDKSEYTVSFNHLNGRTRISEGYVL